MKRFMVLLITCVTVLVVLAGTAAAIDGMVTRIENGYIVINKGIDSQIQPGTILYVTRMGQPVGTVKVAQVDDYNSACQPVETIAGQQFQKGDLVSSQPFQKPDTTVPRPNQPTPAITAGPKSDPNRDKMATQREYEKTVIAQYEKVMKAHTAVRQFHRGAGGVVKIDAMSVLHLATPAIFGAPYTAWETWSVISMTGTAAYGYFVTKNPERVRNVTFEVTLWDTDYLDAFASYYAFKESSTDPRTINTIKENIYRQKGLDKFYVFQVKIINPGPGSVQIAPFPLHFYIKGPGVQQIRPDNYDEVLDKALAPNQVVNGYVYFRRYDDAGQPLFSGRNVTVHIADVLGKGDSITFGHEKER